MPSLNIFSVLACHQPASTGNDPLKSELKFCAKKVWSFVIDTNILLPGLPTTAYLNYNILKGLTKKPSTFHMSPSVTRFGDLAPLGHFLEDPGVFSCPKSPTFSCFSQIKKFALNPWLQYAVSIKRSKTALQNTIGCQIGQFLDQFGLFFQLKDQVTLHDVNDKSMILQIPICPRKVRNQQ